MHFVSCVRGEHGYHIACQSIALPVVWLWLGLTLIVSGSADAQPVRIMPLGDSITESHTDHNSYRRALWHMLNDQGYEVDFVGSMTGVFPGGLPPIQDFDMDHEGHWGWRADELLNQLPGWLGGYTPDIVLMHVGTNDCFQGNSTSSTITELGQIIDVIRTDNPDVVFLFAQLIPATSSLDRIIELNANIPSLAASKNTAQSPVIVVDQYTGFNASADTWDGVHPNDTGEQKMATKWYDAILPFLITIEEPTYLTATAVSHNEVHLTWQDNSFDPQEDEFVIERKPYHNLDQWHEIARVGQDVTTYNDTELIYGYVTYTYRVGAYKE